MTKITLFSLVLLGVLTVFPAVSSAAVYHYIDMTGTVQDIEAPNSDMALAMTISSGQVLHSGVKLDQGLLNEGDEFGNVYNYVDIFGNVRGVVAATADAAYILATNIDPNSGLILVVVVR